VAWKTLNTYIDKAPDVMNNMPDITGLFMKTKSMASGKAISAIRNPAAA